MAQPIAELHSPEIAYTVTCTFTDPTVAEEWLAWLCDEHLAEVCAAGARRAYAVRLREEPTRCQAHYFFSDFEAFRRYERQEAPRLRAEGLARFPLERGLSYARTVGTMVVQIAP